MILRENAIRVLIPPDEPPTIALRFLTSGASQTSLRHYFKIGIATLCGIIEEVCETIWKHMLKAVPAN